MAEWVKIPLTAVIAENRTVAMEWDSYFCDIVTDPLGFPTQLRQNRSKLAPRLSKCRVDVYTKSTEAVLWQIYVAS